MRVRELLGAGETEFAAVIAEIDRRLRAEIRERQRRRERIARLTVGESLVLPPEVADFLDRLRSLGIDERIVRFERDGWIPLAAHSSERIPEWIAPQTSAAGRWPVRVDHAQAIAAEPRERRATREL